MQHTTILSKILLTLLCFGMILWLGGSIVRMSTAYDIYEPFSQMELKSGYQDSVRVQTVRLFTYGSLYTGIGFGASFVGFAGLAFLWRSHMKKKGWLFMSLGLFLLSAPWGIYEIFLDTNLYYFIRNDGIKFNDIRITEFFVNRFTKFSAWTMLSYFSAISSVMTIVWQPLNKLKEY